jgi:hypothetical protein
MALYHAVCQYCGELLLLTKNIEKGKIAAEKHVEENPDHWVLVGIVVNKNEKELKNG